MPIHPDPDDDIPPATLAEIDRVVAVRNAGIAYARWIMAIRSIPESSEVPERIAYLDALDRARTEVAAVNNQAIAALTTEDLADLGEVAEPWDPDRLTEFQRLFLDDIIKARAVEFLIELMIKAHPDRWQRQHESSRRRHRDRTSR